MSGTPLVQHDIGGLEAEFGKIDRGEPGYAMWETQTHALLVLLSRQGIVSTDELRRAVEALPGHRELGYYHKWAAAMAAICVEKKVLGQQDWEEAMGGRIKESKEAGLKVGMRVTVKEEDSRVRWRRPHIRTPGYMFGARGVVEKVIGVFPNPEELAFVSARPAGVQPLYLVRFRQVELWKDVGEGYAGKEDDSITAEIYEPWLEEVKAEGEPEVKRRRGERKGVVDHGDHVHDTRHDTEVEAVRREEAVEDIDGQKVGEALLEVLVEAKVVTKDEVRRIVESMDSKGGILQGARMAAMAWKDPAFKARLLEDGNKAALEIGVDASNPNAPTKLVVFENSFAEHHLVVCTLCSCYPSKVLGMAPPWYKSRSYRARAVKEPRKVLQEFGCQVEEGTAVVVHDSTADCRYMVIPKQPKGTESWSEEELVNIITRDCLIGVAHPQIKPL